MTNFMDYALKCAKKAQALGEVPIGAVVVKDDKIISTGYNVREKSQDATMHAEIVAIKRACKKLKSWRLDNCDIYVTLKPCPMCAGAIVNARINTWYYGAKNLNDKEDTIEKIFSNPMLLNHSTKLVYHHNQQCQQILSQFFKSKR